jgi:hypothetical protein
MAQPITAKIEELRFRIKTDPKSRLFFPLAEELRKIGRSEEAEQVLRAGLEHHPSYLSAWVGLGRALRDLGKHRDSIIALTRALQLDGGNVVVARLLGDVYLELDEKVEAIKKYKLVRALLPSIDEELDGVIVRLDREIRGLQVSAADTAEEEASALRRGASGDQESSHDDAPPVASAAVDFTSGAEMGADTASIGAPDSQETAEPFSSTPFSVSEHESTEPDPGSSDAPPFVASEQQSSADPQVQESSPFASAEAPFTEAAPFAETPFETADVTLEAAQAEFAREHHIEFETADAEPMSSAHAESPFEDPGLDSGYGTDAFGLESPRGMHLARAPLSADLASSWDEQQIAVESAAAVVPEHVIELPSEREQASEEAPFGDEGDVFGSGSAATFSDEEDAIEEAPEAAHISAADSTSTLTMAEIYERQGLTSEAQQIYEHILQRDPGNEAVRHRLERLSAAASGSATDAVSDDAPAPSAGDVRARKVARLQVWLAKVGGEGDRHV